MIKLTFFWIKKRCRGYFPVFYLQIGMADFHWIEVEEFVLFYNFFYVLGMRELCTFVLSGANGSFH